MKPIATYSRKRKEALVSTSSCSDSVENKPNHDWTIFLKETGHTPAPKLEPAPEPEPLKTFNSPEPNAFDRLREASKKAGSSVTDHQKKKTSSKFVFKSTAKAQAEPTKAPQQMYLDLGQSNFTTQVCAVCGMAYTPGQPEDEALHQKFHKDSTQALSFNGWKNEDVVKSFSDGSRILRIVHKDLPSMHRKKLDEIKQLLNRELGFTEDPLKDHLYTTFAYVHNKRIKGIVIAEPIKEAHPIVPNVTPSPSGSPDSEPNNSNNNSTASKSNTRRVANDELIRCSKETRPAALGINRVYVSPEARRKSVASRLLDAVRFNTIFGTVIEKEFVAFSQPTEDGHRLASKYLGHSYLVYQ